MTLELWFCLGVLLGSLAATLGLTIYKRIRPWLAYRKFLKQNRIDPNEPESLSGIVRRRGNDER